MASTKTHIVVSTFPGQGHINPMLQFSKRLSSKGVKVTLVTTSTLNILGSNIQIQDSPVKIEQIYDGFNEGDKIESADAYLRRFNAVASQSLAELIQKLNNSECPPEVLVYDSVMPWALEVAHGLGLRGASFFTQSCDVSAIYYHLEAGHIKIPLEESPASLPSLPLLETNDMPCFFCNLTGGSDPSLLSLVVNQFSNFQKADWLLFNTFDKLEEEVHEKLCTCLLSCFFIENFCYSFSDIEKFSWIPHSPPYSNIYHFIETLVYRTNMSLNSNTKDNT